MRDTAEANPGRSALLDYRPGDAWDEAFTGAGAPRAEYESLLEELAEVDLLATASAITAALEAKGCRFGGRDGDTPFRLDPVPRLVGPSDWDRLERGLLQRSRALSAFIADVYSERAIVNAGIVPARVVDSAEYLEPWMEGVATPAAGFFAGLDIVRDSDGELAVLEDNCRTPSGLAYVLAARAAVDAHLPVSPPTGRLEPASGLAAMARALRASAPDGDGDPSIVLLSDGPANSAWYEHQILAAALEIPLVMRDDLLVRRGRLHAWVGDADTRPVDVVYRRTDEDRLRDEHGRATWIADCLLAPLRAGVLTVVNPFGAGVADDKLAHAYVEQMVRFYLREEPLLPSVRTYDLGNPDVLTEQLPRLGELVVKPRGGYGGIGVVVGPRVGTEQRAAVKRSVTERPGDFVAQELVLLSTHPTLRDGRLVPRHVDLRPFVLGADADAEVVPGGLTRVAFAEDQLVVNSSQDGGGKDTWVLAK